MANSTIRISGKKKVISTESSIKWKLQSRPGGWWIAESESGIRKRFCFTQRQDQFGLSIGGCLYQGKWIVEHARTSESHSSGSDSELVAQFPGRVRKILVQEGAIVQEGEPMLFIEAMKMEFIIRAPYTAKIKKILVQESQQLAPGDLFVELEENKK